MLEIIGNCPAEPAKNPSCEEIAHFDSGPGGWLAMLLMQHAYCDGHPENLMTHDVTGDGVPLFSQEGDFFGDPPSEFNPLETNNAYLQLGCFYKPYFRPALLLKIRSTMD